MDRVKRIAKRVTAVEAFASLRVAGAVVAIAVVAAAASYRMGVVETLAAMVTSGAIGVALAHAFQRRARQIEELAAGRAALLHDALDAEERERARIGERLHDGTLQLLLAAQQDVREARAGYLQSLEFADESLTDAVRALRETVLGLQPAALHERGLELALRVELDRVTRRSRIEVELAVDPGAAGPHDALLYAAGRELVGNAVKHASAARIAVSLERTPAAVVLTVLDDGIGMSVGAVTQTALAEGHVGLHSTRQRIEAAGGRLYVRSAPGEGTTVVATVPVGVAADAPGLGGTSTPRDGRSRDELEAERQFIAAVLENLGEGVVACDEAGELRIVNASARRLVAAEPVGLAELVDRGELRRAAGDEAIGRDDLPLRRALQGVDVAAEEYLAGDPRHPRRSLIIAGRPIDGAGGAVMTIRDVTEQRDAQRASQEAQERFRVAFEHAPIGMAIAALDGRLKSVNRAFAQLTGVAAPALALARTTLETILHPEDVEGTAAGLQALEDGSGGAVFVADKRVLHADGHSIWVALQVVVIRDGDGRPEQLLVQLQDITERRREEERLRTLADRDELTLLLNRNGFTRALRRHAARIERYGADGGVLMVDVDGLCAINAALGRGGGDDVLRHFGAALETHVRRSDLKARIGDDEFALLVPHGDADGLMALADALIVRLAEVQADASARLGTPITVSIGAAAFGAGATEADTVLRRATAAMDAAARAGGGQALLFGPAVLAGPGDH